MTTKKKKTDASVDVSKAFEELEHIATWFESDKTDIDEGMAKFERATELAKSLKEKLTEAQNRIQEIRGTIIDE
ncbi:MAG: exodeoxyribonuclease VII small subunit [Candidatus Magasanikbacteria bacterium]|nr:exodeoxyribonuclease VII small subunit [Candidatus Magasanikbacteria bacterium]MCA9389215.1 exodeoxyribonuclease VII small subunit [Candidatus Magasanikbacteria bacterium]MCA9390844.1 exodeoxyribonuclease VII small subunit [Candidatus Magasanikbacteria bacterium]USN52210.1 MAG: exodeoxyribonuclease VII small subunit [Candidatus Nomurabacteria bacterium]HPF95079.1 exodeoxyribonuclease VII small subunit [bacterium]